MEFSTIEIDNTIPLYAEYFHAINLKEKLNLWFDNNLLSLALAELKKKESPDATIDSLKAYFKIRQQLNLVLSEYTPQSNKRFVALKGLLYLPKTAEGVKAPLVLIGHGGSAVTTKLSEEREKEKEIEVRSYQGYQVVQEKMAKEGIASFSIDLNVVNDLFFPKLSGTKTAFTIDFNQRILMFLLHLMMLKVIAGETLNLPDDEPFPIKYMAEGKLENLDNALLSAVVSEDPALKQLKNLCNLLFGKIDFEKLGFMGHSRGADAVSRIPAFFYKNGEVVKPSFGVNPEVGDRIKKITEFIGKPSQGVIKCILALEPTSQENTENPSKHGYVMENDQTMFFTVVGGLDQDVTLDSVRIYEYPECPKAMIAIAGANHHRFNSVWRKLPRNLEKDKNIPEDAPVRLLSIDDHNYISKYIFGSCLIAALTGESHHYLYLTRRLSLPLKKKIDFQSAWKFGFSTKDKTVSKAFKSLGNKLTSPPPLKQLKNTSYKFEQDVEAFYIEQDKDESSTIQIQINPDTDENLSKYSHFSFRFAKGFDLSSASNRIVDNNFTIQFFEDSSPIGKVIHGKDLDHLKLKAYKAFGLELMDHDHNPNTPPDLGYIFEHSILLQTVEVELANFIPSDRNKVNRIEINILPIKDFINLDSVFKKGRFVAATAGLGFVLVGGGGLLYEKISKKDLNIAKLATIGSVAGAVTGIIYIVKKEIEDTEHSYVFKDFLLTDRQIPIPTKG